MKLILKNSSLEFQKKVVVKVDVTSNMRNGSLGNPSNLNGVAMTNIYDRGEYVAASFETTRPNTTGYHYIFNYRTFDAASGLAQYDTDKVRENEFSKMLTDPEITFNQGELGVAYAIAEVDGNNNYNPLRLTDFTGYKCYLVLS